MIQIQQGAPATMTIIPEKDKHFTDSDRVDALVHNGKSHRYFQWKNFEGANPNAGNILKDSATDTLKFELSGEDTSKMLGVYTVEIRINEQINTSTQISIITNKINSYNIPKPE